MKIFIIMVLFISGLVVAQGNSGYFRGEGVVAEPPIEKETGFKYNKPFSPVGASALNFFWDTVLVRLFKGMCIQVWLLWWLIVWHWVCYI